MCVCVWFTWCKCCELWWTCIGMSLWRFLSAMKAYLVLFSPVCVFMCRWNFPVDRFCHHSCVWRSCSHQTLQVCSWAQSEGPVWRWVWLDLYLRTRGSEPDDCCDLEVFCCYYCDSYDDLKSDGVTWLAGGYLNWGRWTGVQRSEISRIYSFIVCPLITGWIMTSRTRDFVDLLSVWAPGNFSMNWK